MKTKNRNKRTVIRLGTNPKMKTVDLKADLVDRIVARVEETCRRSFCDGGVVNDSDLDEIREMCWKLRR